jgi:hypothetical protein
MTFRLRSVTAECWNSKQQMAESRQQAVEGRESGGN